MDHVGPVDRNDIKVRDELEVMARNEAAKMHADTIKPLGEPADGSQAWGAYQCGSARPVSTTPSAAPAPAASNGTQTFPIQGG
jgi:septal ring-binding cell division protein DamX